MVHRLAMNILLLGDDNIIGITGDGSSWGDSGRLDDSLGYGDGWLEAYGDGLGDGMGDGAGADGLGDGIGYGDEGDGYGDGGWDN